ncbi:HAD hydrolase-like protein [Gordonia sp. CPCC 205515]|uniref:HAD hydrolase-like protein n=1 Tax=Gordonia sp. CPCC 205515 TaxID=3140791 RepID=UPI003AF3C41B
MTETTEEGQTAGPRPDPADPSTVLLVDLDGTITDSFAGIANSFRHALAAVGAPEPTEDVVAGIAGPPMIDTLRELGLDQPTADAAMTAYRERYTEIGWLENAVFDGMGEILADVAADGRTLAVATSKNQTTACAILEHFGLAQHFRVIAGASDDGTRRAKADVIAHALDRLGITDAGVTSTPVVMIGDRAHDVEGAARFGIPAILVGWGYALAGEGETAAWTVDSIADLREVLGV